MAGQLVAEFDQLFSTEIGYWQLDERISKTKEKKENLLVVSTLPEIPLQNNAAELAVRAKVKKRDIIFKRRQINGQKQTIHA